MSCRVVYQLCRFLNGDYQGCFVLLALACSLLLFECFIVVGEQLARPGRVVIGANDVLCSRVRVGPQRLVAPQRRREGGAERRGLPRHFLHPVHLPLPAQSARRV